MSNAIPATNNVLPFRRPVRVEQDSAGAKISDVQNVDCSGAQTKQALVLSKIGLHYQPQIELATNQVQGVEALLRAEGSEGAKLNTALVVASAERLELIEDLGRHVLHSACQEFAQLRRASANVGRLAVNLSPLELRQPDYAQRVAQIIRDAGLDYSDVELEITESWSLTDPTLNLNELVTLAELGVGLAIDDFGVAHTAWVHVLDLPVSTLKIDRSIVSRMCDSKSARIVIENLCRTCDELNIQVVAEGVCSQEQKRLLVEMGCPVGQGFGLGRPLAAEEYVKSAMHLA